MSVTVVPFTPVGVTPDTSAPSAFTPAGVTPSTTPPVVFTPAAITPDASAPTPFTPAGVTPDVSAPLPFFPAVSTNFDSVGKLAAQPTLTVTPGSEVVVTVTISGVWTIYTLTAGTSTGSGGQVLPYDYNASTNAKYWYPTSTG